MKFVNLTDDFALRLLRLSMGGVLCFFVRFNSVDFVVDLSVGLSVDLLVVVMLILCEACGDMIGIKPSGFNNFFTQLLLDAELHKCEI